MKKPSPPKKSVLEWDLRPRASIREMHEDGKRLKRMLDQDKSKSRQALLENKASETGVNLAELRKRIAFATKYHDPAALKELLALKNLTWSHVRKLLTVEDEEKRQKFAVKANKEDKVTGECWSVHKLACEIEGRLRERILGGRKPKSRPLTPGTLHEYKQEIDQIQRLFTAFLEGDHSKDPRLTKVELKKCGVLLSDLCVKLDELETQLPDFKEKVRAACLEAGIAIDQHP